MQTQETTPVRTTPIGVPPGSRSKPTLNQELGVLVGDTVFWTPGPGAAERLKAPATVIAVGSDTIETWVIHNGGRFKQSVRYHQDPNNNDVNIQDSGVWSPGPNMILRKELSVLKLQLKGLTETVGSPTPPPPESLQLQQQMMQMQQKVEQMDTLINAISVKQQSMIEQIEYLKQSLQRETAFQEQAQRLLKESEPKPETKQKPGK